MQNNKKKLSISTIFFASFVFVVFFSTLSTYMMFYSTNGILDKKIAEARELARPADLKITVLKASECDDCFDITPILDSIKKSNIKIESETWLENDDDKAINLIAQYGIIKLPSIIIEGEINKEEALRKIWTTLGEIKDENTFVFTKTRPPYVLTINGKIKGRIKIEMLTDRECDGCYDVTGNVRILASMGMPVSEQKVLEVGFGEGLKLKNKYNIKLLPTVIISGDIEEYPTFKNIWTQVGTIEKDGTYVLRNGIKRMGGYKDLVSGKIVNAQKTVNLNAAKKQSK